MKISYSSMVNMTNLSKQHNARLLKNQEHTEKSACKQIPLLTMNVKNTSEQLSESLNRATTITPCHLKTRRV